ncbi:MAG: DUF1573 domain-containing protein [Desulfobacca sp.]|uniref:DUF1573 domain-containing protein n=1 Tax=Desulfobacca sp. TaxID=2067990 RepID=UPI004048FA57
MHLHQRSPLLLGLAVFGLWFGIANVANAGPRAEVSQIVYDFGEVFEDQALTHTFEVKNVGDAPLIIKHIDSDCACTTSEADRRIPPGGVGRIQLTIAPYSVLRQFAKKTTLFLNDPANPAIVLTMQGYGKPFIEIIPNHIVRLEGKPGEEIRKQVRFVSHLKEPWEIKEVRTNIPQEINIKVIPEVPGRSYVVEVSNKKRDSGNFSGNIELFTTSEKRPRMIMRVFGDFYFSGAAGG